MLNTCDHMYVPKKTAYTSNRKCSSHQHRFDKIFYNCDIFCCMFPLHTFLSRRLILGFCRFLHKICSLDNFRLLFAIVLWSISDLWMLNQHTFFQDTKQSSHQFGFLLRPLFVFDNLMDYKSFFVRF